MFIRRESAILRAPEGELPPGGGAGGSNDPPGSGGLTEEDVGRIVNAAVTSQLKRMLPQAVTEAIGGLKLGETINAQIKAALEASGGAGGGGDDGGGKPGGKPAKTPDNEYERKLKELADKLEATERKAQEEARLRSETEQARRQDAAMAQFRSALSSKLRPEMVDIALPHWATVQQRLKVGDDGAALLRVKRAPYKGAPEVDEELPLPEAIPILLATEEAKLFMPPPGGGSNGTPKPGGAPRNVPRDADGVPRYDAPATTDDEKARRSLEREAALRARLNLD